MLTEERHVIILNLLKEKEVVKIHELTEVTGASESTIRRDLTDLENAELLRRVHGGAAKVSRKRTEPTMDEKTNLFSEEKRAAGRLAASLIEDNDCLFIDAGTTTLSMIPFIQAKNIVAVTNGFDHLRLLAEYGFEAYCTGGRLKESTKAMTGTGAVHGLQQYWFDKAFLGVNGIHLTAGYTTPDPEEAAVKKEAFKRAQQSFFVADASKFQESTFAHITELDKAIIVTGKITDNLRRMFEEKTDIKEALT
ncbi:DeoR/GlpR family DNA-binding transcription regulator [Domibacillus epiphyticus]|uniref:DeoR family transcriptional regulator n=1 Tax=Domibacillus epiphyticus TaxID=1714355 RepID=A0A1V2A9T8_9BACI|nr:DeoR/GlpR family DNA-binding transcription regulator [Domibacillus epiphyticus]OMP67751.1 DeoR family transcriptional regulator [Domibacillus epiphyticus]